MRGILVPLAIVSFVLTLGHPPAAIGKEVVEIDFEALTVADADNNHDVGLVYFEEGITVAVTHPVSGNVPHLNFAGTGAPVFAGSTMLFANIGQSEIRLTRDDQDHFHLLAIDVAEIPSFQPNGEPTNLGPFNITFVGTRTNGATVSFTATINPFPVVTTVLFSRFTNLISVHWFQGPGGGPGQSTHQFDNIVVKIPGKPSQ